MNSSEIEFVMRRLFNHAPVKFLGVFARDTMPDLAKIHVYSPCCYISNTEPKAKKGKHWVAFFHLSPTSIEYHLSHIQRIFHNSTQVQGDYSRVCGNYCVYFLDFRAQGHTIKNITQHLKSFTFAESDSRVASFIQRIHDKK